MTDHDTMSADDLIARLRADLAPRRRLRGAAPLILGSSGAIALGSLWITEPGVPVRTDIGFGVLLAACAAWAVYGGWLVTRRAPLFAKEKVVAGWIAVVAATATTVVMTASALARDSDAWPPVVAGGTLLAVAAVALGRAYAWRARLRRIVARSG